MCRIARARVRQSFPLSRRADKRKEIMRREREGDRQKKKRKRDILFDESLSSRRSVEILYSLFLSFALYISECTISPKWIEYRPQLRERAKVLHLALYLFAFMNELLGEREENERKTNGILVLCDSGLNQLIDNGAAMLLLDSLTNR